MNEDKFIDVLTNGLGIPEPVEWTRLPDELKQVYMNNLYSIPIDDNGFAWGKIVLDYVCAVKKNKYVQQQTLIP